MSWYQSAQVDASRDGEDGSHVESQLLGSNGAGRGEAALDRRGSVLNLPQSIPQAHDVRADGGLVHADGLLVVEACNFRDEEHDSVVTAHELRQAQRGVAHVQLTICVGELRLSADDGRSENIDPRCESHVEGRLVSSAGHVDH